jgi:putative peptidoglycan lipid II flippase
MGLVLHYAMGSADWWLAAGGQAKLAALAALVVLGAAAYGACLFAMGFRLRQFARAAAP